MIDEVTRKLSSNMLVLCVDTWKDMVLTGSMYSVMKKDPISFVNFEQMVFLADALFDEIAFPQASQKKRTFAERPCKALEFGKLRKDVHAKNEKILVNRGKKSTFVLLVEARQFTNWQGKVLDTKLQLLDHFDDIIGLLNILIKEIR